MSARPALVSTGSSSARPATSASELPGDRIKATSQRGRPKTRNSVDALALLTTETDVVLSPARRTYGARNDRLQRVQGSTLRVRAGLRSTQFAAPRCRRQLHDLQADS